MTTRQPFPPSTVETMHQRWRDSQSQLARFSSNTIGAYERWSFLRCARPNRSQVFECERLKIRAFRVSVGIPIGFPERLDPNFSAKEGLTIHNSGVMNGA